MIYVWTKFYCTLKYDLNNRGWMHCKEQYQNIYNSSLYQWITKALLLNVEFSL